MKDKIINLLSKNPDKFFSVGAIAKRLNSNPSTISIHLKELEKRGKIKSYEAEIIILTNNMWNKCLKRQTLKIYTAGEVNGRRKEG